MCQTYQWNVIPTQAPSVLRSCPKCGGGARFYSTGKFRVNAQQKTLDVWLIYACGRCAATWNLPVLSRVKAADIPKYRYRAFLCNDSQAALACALDRELLRRAKAEAEFSAIPYRVCEEAPLPPSGVVLLDIRGAVPLPLRLDKLLCEQLGLSRRALSGLFESGAIENLNSAKGERARLTAPARLRVDLEALRLAQGHLQE